MVTSKQRVLTAVEHRTTDRVPITFDAVDEVYDALCGYLAINSKEALFDRLNVDTWMILPGNFKYPKPEHGKTDKTTIWGYKTRITQYSGGSYDELVHSPLAGKNHIDDIRQYPWLSPEILDFSHFPAEAEDHQDRAIIGVFTHGAFHVACYLRSMTDLMMDFALRKNYAQHLLGRISEVSLAVLDRMLESYGSGIDIVYMCDDYCSQEGPLFSPDVFRELVVPYLGKAVEKGRITEDEAIAIKGWCDTKPEAVDKMRPRLSIARTARGRQMIAVPRGWQGQLPRSAD